MLRPGDVITTAKNFYATVYCKQHNEQDDVRMYSEIEEISGPHRLIIVEQASTNGWLVENNSSWEKAPKPSVISSSHILWCCLLNGKQIWISNLDTMEYAYDVI
jgi:hypothetical protein